MTKLIRPVHYKCFECDLRIDTYGKVYFNTEKDFPEELKKSILWAVQEEVKLFYKKYDEREGEDWNDEVPACDL